jgi:phosphoribosylformylglycinamidine (FGAM) synthase-like amidotransferase family enzyme
VLDANSPEPNIYILQLQGNCSDCGTAVQAMLKSGGRASRIIGASEVASVVRSGVDVIVVPGGYDYDG